MYNFKVQDNDFTLNSCDPCFKLVFIWGDGGSKVTPKDFPDIHLYKLNFKILYEINNGNYLPDLLLGKII